MEVLEVFKFRDPATGEKVAVEITEEDLTSYGRHELHDEKCTNCFMGCHTKPRETSNQPRTKDLARSSAPKIAFKDKKYFLTSEQKAQIESWAKKEREKIQPHLDFLKREQEVQNLLCRKGGDLVKEKINGLLKDDTRLKRIVEDAVGKTLLKIKAKTQLW
jgi:hypothetical protein